MTMTRARWLMLGSVLPTADTDMCVYCNSWLWSQHRPIIIIITRSTRNNQETRVCKSTNSGQKNRSDVTRSVINDRTEKCWIIFQNIILKYNSGGHWSTQFVVIFFFWRLHRGRTLLLFKFKFFFTSVTRIYFIFVYVEQMQNN